MPGTTQPAPVAPSVYSMIVTCIACVEYPCCSVVPHGIWLLLLLAPLLIPLPPSSAVSAAAFTAAAATTVAVDAAPPNADTAGTAYAAAAV